MEFNEGPSNSGKSGTLAFVSSRLDWLQKKLFNIIAISSFELRTVALSRSKNMAVLEFGFKRVKC